MPKHEEVVNTVVIGGGIHGCSVALHLAKHGLTCILVEKDYVGRHASGVNAGGVRRLGRALPEIPIANLSSKIWHQIENLTDDDCGFQISTQIKVAESDSDFIELKSRVKEVSRLGFSHEEILNRNELFEWLPALSKHCVGGIIVRGDGHANPFRSTLAFKRKAMQLGVEVLEGAAVLSINQTDKIWRIQTRKQEIFCENVVNCAGAWGKEIGEMLGDFVPVSAYAPMLMITSPLPQFVKPVVGSQSSALSFKQLTNGTVLIGGGYRGHALPGLNHTELNFSRLSANVKAASALFPIIKKTTIVRAWAGIEGFTPDELPIIGTGKADGVFHAFAFSAHGFQMGPAVGKIISDLIVNGTSGLPLNAFRVDRFENKETFH